MKIYYKGNDQTTETQYHDFVSKDKNHDSYMTMCCLDYLFTMVCKCFKYSSQNRLLKNLMGNSR